MPCELRRRDNGVCVQQHMQMPAPTNNINNMQEQAPPPQQQENRKIKEQINKRSRPTGYSNDMAEGVCRWLELQTGDGYFCGQASTTGLMSFAYARHGAGYARMRCVDNDDMAMAVAVAMAVATVKAVGFGGGPQHDIPIYTVLEVLRSLIADEDLE
ncbi:unnamed protein product [Ceratitis capitata]|uniref:(Mediterranean fruit fly) hypothetical protein n=1 Tax=Ceratitis capitata TaxID=7213 RepID=A0A811U3A3_CERCA|nr:unnamed protein product [Ceratitis capitata]